MICNIGDSMSRWTNNRLRSTMHRVVMPPAVTSPSSEAVANRTGDANGEKSVKVPGRRSVVFFGKPDKHGSLAPVPELLREDEKPAFPDITAGEYNTQRLVRIYS